ncbi:hypothetical protein MSR1_00180 [Magnetospirillum gryphiswaldense MSR-1]|nr:hypothetical protein MSR1_00180 [Magnetospirillum gryphiswaldense MSR-1]AVM76451.1 hypothetical protein MSR1L_00180 [Magnetospirillum gryphiswaldense]
MSAPGFRHYDEEMRDFISRIAGNYISGHESGYRHGQSFITMPRDGSHHIALRNNPNNAVKGIDADEDTYVGLIQFMNNLPKRYIHVGGMNLRSFFL